MNRRNLFKMFGGAIAAAVLPLGALALPKRWNPNDAEVGWTKDSPTYPMGEAYLHVEDFKSRILDPAMRRMAENLDAEIMRIMK